VRHPKAVDDAFLVDLIRRQVANGDDPSAIASGPRYDLNPTGRGWWRSHRRLVLKPMEGLR